MNHMKRNQYKNDSARDQTLFDTSKCHRHLLAVLKIYIVGHSTRYVPMVLDLNLASIIEVISLNYLIGKNINQAYIFIFMCTSDLLSFG